MSDFFALTLLLAAACAAHPPHRRILQKMDLFLAIPLACLAIELLSMQGKLVNNKHFLKENFSETIYNTNRQKFMLLLNL